jgi:hypothetical protein
MELLSAEVAAIERQVSEWIEHPEYELETTFGSTGQVDATTFLNVAKRLRAKGYKSLPQLDRMTIMTKDHIRFTLSSIGIIQQYCRDDILAGKDYEAMIKDRSTASSTLEISEYNFRIKTRREIDMAKDDAEVKRLLEQWPVIPKAFRILRRWTFESEGLRIDMSIIRSTSKLSKGDYKWQRKFRDQDVMKSAPIYEIEVELQHLDGDTKEIAVKRLIKGVGEVLRGIQKSTTLIRKSTKTAVLAAYKTLTGTDRFRGPSMRTLQKRNFLKDRVDGEANIRDGYNVTDKADGLRCLGFCNDKGELFLIDMNMINVYRTGLKNIECRLSLVDGEWVTLTKDKDPIQQFLLFDIFYMTDKKDVSGLPFESPLDKELEGRHGCLKKWVETWNKGDGPKVIDASLTPKTRLQISIKEFKFAKKGDDSIFRAAKRVLDTARMYYTDGLIFTPNRLGLPGAGETFYEQFKWKPPADNTIDFLVRFEKVEGTERDLITFGMNPDTNQEVMYKTLRLFVGSSSENARNIILNNLELPKKNRLIRGAEGIKGEYKPTLFSPKEIPDTQASICRLEVETDPDTGETFVKTEDAEPILDKTIVEMSYNPKAAPGWRWVPERIRMDKTERLQSGVLGRTLNSDKVAEDVWNSIYDPITKHMVISGDEEPSVEEQEALLKSQPGLGKKYYNRTAAPEQDLMLTRSMRDFHNKFIKERILYRVGLGGTGKTLIDTACGVGADLQIWRRCKVAFVLGVDYSDENIRGDKDSIYRRYLESMVTAGGRDGFPQMVFAIGNSMKDYVNGDAGTTDEEKNILRSVLGRTKPSGALPPYIESGVAARLKTGADCMSCMFALHYFFESTQSFRGYLRNISENLKVGGYFIGACFDGEKVFQMLRETKLGSNKVGSEGDATIWTITKQYDNDDMPEGEESLGLAIDVNFTTIGTIQREYLVSFKFLTESMKEIGCEPLTSDDLKALGLKESAAGFETSWQAAKGLGIDYVMPKAVKDFSFLNRWFIFKRTKLAGAADESTSGLKSLKTAANELVRGDAQRNDEEETAVLNNAAAASKLVEEKTEQKTYASGELFQFYADAAERDVLQIGDTKAAQWLSPTALFPIEDPSDPDTIYPSLEHYLVAMRYKVASNKPELAGTIFGKDGTIHQQFLRKRLEESEGGAKPLAPAREREFDKLEMAAVKEASRPSAFKKYKAVFDEAKWASKKDEVLREGLRQRWETDARFRKIVEAARDKGKTLLYYTPGANSSNMGGVRKNTGLIEGENKIGAIIMELAGF